MTSRSYDKSKDILLIAGQRVVGSVELLWVYGVCGSLFRLASSYILYPEVEGSNSLQ